MDHYELVITDENGPIPKGAFVRWAFMLGIRALGDVAAVGCGPLGKRSNIPQWAGGLVILGERYDTGATVLMSTSGS